MKIIALTAMALGLAAVQSTCPGVTLTGKLPSSIRPGTTTYYQLKVGGGWVRGRHHVHYARPTHPKLPSAYVPHVHRSKTRAPRP